MQNEPPRFLVAVLAYNRPASLNRLLGSLGKAYDSECRADLLISIDGEGDPECESLGKRFDWHLGEKDVYLNPVRLGLKEHVENVTDRVDAYDAIIVMEDDLSVSPWVFNYCRQSYQAWLQDEKVAQISLYSHRMNEFSGLPFLPIEDGSDAWFARVPSSWGQMYTRDQWKSYRGWLNSGKPGIEKASIPDSVYQWRVSWKRNFFEYVSATRKWVVYPYYSLTTNHGDAGENFPYPFLDVQVPVDLRKRDYNFITIEESRSKYDEFFEPLPELFEFDTVDPNDVEVDLQGCKNLSSISLKYLLSTKQCSEPIQKYASSLIPLENNIRLHTKPSEEEPVIALGKTEDFSEESKALDLACQQTARSVQTALFLRGFENGTADIRKSRSFKLGEMILSPLRKLKQLIARN